MSAQLLYNPTEKGVLHIHDKFPMDGERRGYAQNIL